MLSFSLVQYNCVSLGTAAVPHEGDTSLFSVDEVPSQHPVMFCGHLTLRVHSKNLMREMIMMHYGTKMSINYNVHKAHSNSCGHKLKLSSPIMKCFNSV